jgi:hypothetical protein
LPACVPLPWASAGQARLGGSSPLGRQQTRQLPTVIVAQAAALGWSAGD